MDTIGLVENKENGYDYERLHYDQKMFIDGIRESSLLVDNVAYDYQLTADTSGKMTDKIEWEIIQAFVEDLKTHLYATECEYIVAFEDDNYCEVEE